MRKEGSRGKELGVAASSGGHSAGPSDPSPSVSAVPAAAVNAGALLDLAARCEAATAADRFLDAEIAKAAIEKMPAGATHDENCHGWLRSEEWAFGCWKAPAYTASLDAAMSLLVGHGVLITLSEIKGDGMPMCVVGNPATSALFEAVADSPALALTAAALRARAASGIVAATAGETACGLDERSEQSPAGEAGTPNPPNPSSPSRELK